MQIASIANLIDNAKDLCLQYNKVYDSTKVQVYNKMDVGVIVDITGCDRREVDEL